MSTTKKRVIAEKDALDQKRHDLQDYFLSDHWKTLESEMHHLLSTQYQSMTMYSNILARRLKIWKS